MKTVSNGLIPERQKDVQHIVSTGRERATAVPLDNAHCLSQSSFTFHSESQAGCSDGLVFGHKE